MLLRSALLLFLTMLIPVARADEQREQAKQKLAQELLKALLEDDDDDEEDKPKKAKPAPKKEKAGKTFEPAADAAFSAEAHSLTPGAIYPSLILATATIKDDGSPDDPTDATHYGDPMATLGVRFVTSARTIRSPSRYRPMRSSSRPRFPSPLKPPRSWSPPLPK